MKKVILGCAFLSILLACNKEDDVINPPAIFSISPLSGGYGTELTITGKNFSSRVSDNVVTINDVEALVQSATPTSLVVLVPALTEGSLPVEVVSEGGEARGVSFTYNYDIFVAGCEGNSSGFTVAKYWKNDIAVPLSDGTKYSYAEAIAISGNDIYVAGWERDAGIDGEVARCWKNGSEYPLTTGYSDAYDICLYGNDVYIAGKESNGTTMVAKYWKNGLSVSLTNGNYYASASAITISNGEVYVAGFESNGTKSVAKYWKNGVQVVLGDGTNYSEANDIVVIGSDVYVTGIEYNNANKPSVKYWKNGNATSLSVEGNIAYGYSIAVTGTDVYVAGCEDYDPSSTTLFDARYWKNGVMTSLTNNSSHATASSLYLIGSDVFVSGSGSEGEHDVAKYWKNGSLVNLTNGNWHGYANDIVVR